MPEISVVVPTRDVEAYVGEVLDDLVDQTFSDFEVIAIDDGSTDSTQEILARYAGHHRRVSLLSSGGDGVSAARNLGVANASGEFLAFVDGDDRVSPNYLRTLHRSIVDTGSDLVSCNAHRLERGHTSPSMLHRRACAKTRPRTHLSRYPTLVWDTTVWNKLWRREMWDRAGLRYTEGRWLNDFLPSIHGHVASRQVDVIGEALYYWRVRDDPATSITDRRLTDPNARLKSFDDRVFAIARARDILSKDLALPAVLDAFDYRILHNDLPIYLPYYSEADDNYRELIVSHIQQLLERFCIRPERFHLGTVLQHAYRSIQNSDHSRLATVLDRDTHVVVAPGLSSGTDLISPGTTLDDRPRSSDNRLNRHLGRLRSRLSSSSSVTAQAQVDRVEVSPTSPTHLTVHGVTRIRDGRSDVAGRVTAAASISTSSSSWRGKVRSALARYAASSASRLTGQFAAVGPPPDEALHPLVRSGWRPFTTSIDLSERGYRKASSWRLGIVLKADETTVYARTTLAPGAAATLPPGVRVSRDTDLVLATGRRRHLRLYPTYGALRLVSVDQTASGPCASFAPSFPPGSTVWLQSARSNHCGPESETRAEAQLLPPDGLESQNTYELWYRNGRHRGRVRAESTLQTTRIAWPTSWVPANELLLGPDARGYVVLAVRAPCLSLRWVDRDDDAVLLGGSGDPSSLTDSTVVLRCRWANETIPITVVPVAEGWRSSVPVSALADGNGGPGRPWSVEVADTAGRREPIHIAPESRSHIPQLLGLRRERVRVTFDEDGTLFLSVGGDHDRWRKLQRVQSSTLSD